MERSQIDKLISNNKHRLPDSNNLTIAPYRKDDKRFLGDILLVCEHQTCVSGNSMGNLIQAETLEQFEMQLKILNHSKNHRQTLRFPNY